MKKLLISLLVALIIQPVYHLNAQNTVVTDDAGYSAHSSAMLDVKSVNKGLLVPRMTTAQMNAIVSPATGLLVFNTDKNCFCYRADGEWVVLSSQLLPQNATMNEALFHVINASGDTVFAVYPEGVRINVGNGLVKGSGNKGGFAIGGLSGGKAGLSEYFRVTPDSVRIYVDTATNKGSGNKGGFAIGGLSGGKTTLIKDLMKVTMDSIRIYIDPVGSTGSGNKGGFAIGGLSGGKLGQESYFNISPNESLIINPSKPRILFYPIKNAFLAGQVLVNHTDSVGLNSASIGYESKAIGDFSMAFGFHARAKGNNATAIGNYADARARSSFAMGDSAVARGTGSYAFGTTGLDTVTGAPTVIRTIANGNHSFAFGFGAYADKTGSLAMGAEAAAMGQFSLALGLYDTAYADFSYAIGLRSLTKGKYAGSFGTWNEASGGGSFTIGSLNIASANGAIAFGTQDTASALCATAIGYNSRAKGQFAVSVGSGCKATGFGAAAFGFNNSSTNSFATSFGNGSIASGAASTAFGNITQATNWYATSFGASTVASGHTSTAFGNATTASGMYSTAMGNKIIVSGHNSFGIGLNDTQFTIAQDNTMAVMGGKVGIGTEAPATELEVNGTVSIDDFLVLKKTARYIINLATLTPDRSFIRLRGGTAMSPQNVTLNSTTAIANGTYDGQVLILEGFTDSNGTVTINDGANTRMNGNITLGQGDIIMFIWDSDNTWVEISRSDN